MEDGPLPPSGLHLCKWKLGTAEPIGAEPIGAEPIGAERLMRGMEMRKEDREKLCVAR